MTRAAAVLLVVVAFASGCAREDPAERALLETATRLDDVRSGSMKLRLVVDDHEQSDGSGLGFQIEGAFSLPAGGGELATADVEYTRIAGSTATTVGFVSTGDRAFVEVNGQTYELPNDQVSAFRASEGAAGLERLRLYDWVERPRLDGGARRDGVAVDRIRAQLDPAAVLRDLVRFANSLGAELGAVTEADAEQIARAVSASRFEVLTGRDDRLLRRLVVDMQFTPPAGYDAELADVVGGRITFELDLARVNEPVSVDAPEDARPFSELDPSS